MLNRNWHPADMVATEEAGYKVKPPDDGHVSAGDAERLMVIYQGLSEDWAGHYSNATYFKETARFKRDAAYQIAFMRSEAKSDRQRDVDAKQDPSVRVADQNLNEATAALKLAELRYDGSVRAYHSMKKICEMAHEEKKFL
jgi:hypothetical protein